MSVSTSHNQFPSQWFSVESPDAWVPQVTNSVSHSSLIYDTEDKFSHATFNHHHHHRHHPVNTSPSEEELWCQLPTNSGCNWSDFVHIPPSAGINAESISPYSATASPATYSPSYWDNPLSLNINTPNNKDDPNLQSDNSYSPGYPRIQRNIDIEAELSRQNLYKTELCRSWVESASCKYGSKCQFAHGQHELRPVIRHPKYKTEICKTFHTNGTCPYGKRCRFVHNPAELRMAADDGDDDEMMKSLTSEAAGEDDEELRQVQERFKLANLAPDPVFTQACFPVNLPVDVASSTTDGSKKGSSLPFFQKLRKQKHC